MKSAGSLESSDCLITLKKNNSNQININIESIVFDQFGDQIHEVILKTLKRLNAQSIDVLCQDKGALDYTIEARLITAYRRLEGEKNE